MNSKLSTTLRGTFWVAFLPFILAACASGEALNLKSECTYSNGDDAPLWTCNSSVALEYSNLNEVAWATGESRKLNAGRGLQQKAAVLDGRAKLLERIVVRVKSLIEKHAEGNNADLQIKLFVESFSEGTLKGSRSYTRAIDPGDGHMYVIVGIENDLFKKNIEENEEYQDMLKKIELDKAAGGKVAVEAIKEDLSDISKVVLQ